MLRRIWARHSARLATEHPAYRRQLSFSSKSFVSLFSLPVVTSTLKYLALTPTFSIT